MCLKHKRVNPSGNSNFNQNVEYWRCGWWRWRMLSSWIWQHVVWWKFAYVAMNPAPIFGLCGGNRFIPDVCKYMQGYMAPHFTRQFFKWWIVCGAQVHESYTNPSVSDPIRETVLLQKNLRTDIDALVIAKLYMFVLRVSVWDSCQDIGSDL